MKMLEEQLRSRMGLSAEAFILHLFEDNLFNFISTRKNPHDSDDDEDEGVVHYCPLKSRDG